MGVTSEFVLPWFCPQFLEKNLGPPPSLCLEKNQNKKNRNQISCHLSIRPEPPPPLSLSGMHPVSPLSLHQPPNLYLQPPACRSKFSLVKTPLPNPHPPPTPTAWTPHRIVEPPPKGGSKGWRVRHPHFARSPAPGARHTSPLPTRMTAGGALAIGGPTYTIRAIPRGLDWGVGVVGCC